MKMDTDLWEIVFPDKYYKSLTYLPDCIETRQEIPGIWRVTPDDHLNDQEHEKKFWNCKFLQVS